MGNDPSDSISNAAESRHISELLASERTFLAWVRTSIAVISLGFVIARFSFWLNEMAVSTGQHLLVPHTGLSLPIGLGMMAFGGLMTLLAALRYEAMNWAIRRGEIYSSQLLIRAVTIATVVLAVLLIIYLLVASGQL